jgi:hypothetical protein
MTERKRNAAWPDADPDDPENERSSSGLPPTHEDAVRPADQAISNEEQALESGEENVV